MISPYRGHNNGTGTFATDVNGPHISKLRRWWRWFVTPQEYFVHGHALPELRRSSPAQDVGFWVIVGLVAIMLPLTFLCGSR